MGKHVMECLGMSKILIENGKVIAIEEPKIKYCPLFKKYHDIDEINTEVIRKNIEFRIESFGMCCDSRTVRMKDFLSFGISEILSSSLKNSIIDVAVIAADGCGTSIITDPEIVQGLGGRISGICETSPIENVIKTVGPDNVVDVDNTTIDMLSGVNLAFSKGYKKIAVTITNVNDAKILRKQFKENIIIIAVHTTGTSKEDAALFFDCCDIITACASLHLREESKKRDIIVAGNKVPVYGVSDIGKKLVLMKLKEVGKDPWVSGMDEDPPYPLI